MQKGQMQDKNRIRKCPQQKTARTGEQMHEDLVERLPEPVNSDEISRLAKTFNHMLDRLQSSVNQLRTVTGAVAHDLKSPVTLIRGTLESALCNEGNDNWRNSVGEAIEELDRLLQFLNTTLDLSEAKAGALHMNRSPVDFSDAVRQLVDIYQPAMAERRISKAEPSPSAQGIAMLFRLDGHTRGLDLDVDKKGC